MSTSSGDRPDLATLRYQNALALFDEFVRQASRKPDAAVLRGLEGRFADRLGIQASYWSQIKARSRQIGERLARQFEEAMGKPWGWMDQVHAPAQAPAPADAEPAEPRTDDERFVVGLVLNYYRRNPERARARLLDLLSDAFSAPPAPPPPPAASAEASLWADVAKGVAPLRRKP